MKKMISVLLVAAFMLLLVTGCEKQQQEKDVNTSELAQALLDGIAFQDELSPIDDTSVLDYLFQLEGMSLAEQTVYESTGATAEEIAVLKASSAEDAAVLKEKASARIEAQKMAYENYVPEELVKLDKAVVETSGNCVILCVTDEDETAKEIIADYLK